MQTPLNVLIDGVKDVLSRSRMNKAIGDAAETVGEITEGQLPDLN